MPTEDEGLTAEERELFEQMVAAIEGNRETVMSVIDGEDPPATPGAAGGDRTATEDHGAAPEPADSRDESATTERSASEPDRAAESGGVDAADLMAGSDSTPDTSTDDAPGNEGRPSEGRSTGSTEPAESAPESAGQSAERPVPDAGSSDAATADAAATDAPAADAATASTDGSHADTDHSADDGRPVPPDLREGSSGAGTEANGSAVESSGGAAESGESAAAASSGGAGASGGQSMSDESPAIDRETVRITDDVGRIFGVDEREYELSREDVVTLPAENATPLVERDVADPLDR